jgi:ribonuclease-3
MKKPPTRSIPQAPPKNPLEQFEKTIGIQFKNRHLIHQVFVHRSYLNEHPDFALDHNERLEFLGDAVLELIVTEHLYLTYPNPEGELTNWRSSIVKGEMLSQVANDLSMNEYLLLSKGEQKSAGKARDLILANAFEALIGAIYLDQGYAIAQTFIHQFLLIQLPVILEQRLYRDSKSLLQEWSQSKYNVTPVYNVLEESGPDHAKLFKVGVYLGEKMAGEGSGPSKQKAEQQAATMAIESLNIH